MPDLTSEHIEQYLQGLLGKRVKVHGLTTLGRSGSEKTMKAYGYGTPVRVDYEADGQSRCVVLHTMSPGPFGHEHMSDRDQVFLWD